MVEDASTSDVHVSKSDRLTSFETNEEIDGRVGVALREFPDALREVGIIGELARTYEIIIAMH